MKNFASWIHRFFDQFTYTGKIRFVGGMVLSLCIFCVGGVLYLQHDIIKMYQAKQTGVKRYQTLSALLKASCDLQLHLAERGDSPGYKDETIALSANMDLLLHSALHSMSGDPSGVPALEAEQILKDNKDLDLTLSEWEAINRGISENKGDTLALLVKFNRRILHLNQRNIQAYRLNHGIEMIIFAVTSITLEKMPQAQSQLTYLAAADPGAEPYDHILGGKLFRKDLIELLRRKVDQMRVLVVQAEKENITGDDPFHVHELSGIFAPYKAAVDKFLATASIKQKDRSIFPVAKAALNAGWKAEGLFLKSLEEDINYALNVLCARNFYTILITVVGFLIFLTMYLTRLMRRPLEMLKSAAVALSKGDLSVRVPITVNDEVSKIIVAFNDMAESWEQNINRAKMVANRLVGISTGMFDIAKQLEDNIARQGELIESMKSQARKITALMENFKLVLGEVNASAFATSMQAENGRHGLAEMEEVTRQMGTAARLIVDTLSLIEGQVERIKGIVNTIVSIADQSNILSLNTAIRANQTGTTGGGFTVVAGKIHELAEQIAFATLDIEKAIHEIVDDVSNAIVEVEQFSAQISGQIDDERSVHQKFSMRIDQTQQQIQTFDSFYSDMEHLFDDTLRIDGMMSSLAKVSSDTDRSVRKLYGDAERLSSKTEGLQSMIARFHTE